MTTSGSVRVDLASALTLQDIQLLSDIFSVPPNAVQPLPQVSVSTGLQASGSSVSV